MKTEFISYSRINSQVKKYFEFVYLQRQHTKYFAIFMSIKLSTSFGFKVKIKISNLDSRFAPPLSAFVAKLLRRSRQSFGDTRMRE